MFCNIWFSSVIADTLQEIKVAHINVGLVYGAYVASNGRFFGFLLSTGILYLSLGSSLLGIHIFIF